MTEPLLAVIDIGTGSVRAHVIAVDGLLIASATRPQHVSVGADGRAEVDPDAIWTAVSEALAAVLARVDPRRIAAVGAASALGYVLLDRDARPLGPAMLWMDRRATTEAHAIGHSIDRERLYRLTGRRLDPEVFLAKLLWLRRHEPDRLAHARTFVGLKDDVVRRLTGVTGTDPTHAAYTMLYDVGGRGWSPELLDLAGIPSMMVPSLGSADTVVGHVTDGAAKATGLVAGTPVITGTSDGTAACLLAGVDAGVAVNVTGTSDVVMARADRPLHDAEQRTLVNPHPLGTGWMVGAVLGTTGGTLRWLAERFCPDLVGDDRYRRLDDDASTVPPGARGVLFLPGLAGDRAPRWNADARGAIVGLDLTHGRAELARAVLDGVALTVRAVVETLR